ncbi:mitochondrial protein Pet127-domain-containing protein [Phycomyces nitens]|nr:mitochondrial protein Pet127-domain-containing protein [Phycomyces nitens]
MTAKANDPMEPNSGDNSGSTNGSWSQVGNEQYRRVEPPSEVKVPSLAHELQRVLFNPGVHFLKDPRTKHYNFTPFLENITQPSEFNYDAIQPYITSSKDKSLLSMAKEHNKRYLGSTSSVSAVLSHFYFTVSNFKPIDTSILSHDFAKEPKTFTRGTRAPASIYLRWKDGVYAVDVDKSHDVEDTILSLMGKSMEKVLTLEPNEYKRYLKDNAIEFPEEEKNQPESYAYGQIGKFLLRSQLDCYDSRLPRGTFDLKTRAAIPIRLDMSNYSDYLGYSLKRSHGLMESFEREYYDMMRSAFLKYSFQVRIGHMDGILVAYHNTSKLFGFQYISREEMDSRIFGTTRTGDEAFRNTLSLFEAVLDKATDKYPNQTLRLSFDARKPKDSHLAHMNIFVEAVPPEEEAKTESRAAEDTCVGQFFQTRDPALEPYRDMTMYILKTQSFVHGLPINENISLKRNTDDWEVRYKINEVAKDPVVVETMFRNLRKTQSKIFSASSYPIPILKKLKSLSKKELEKQGQEMDDSEHIKTEFE